MRTLKATTDLYSNWIGGQAIVTEVIDCHLKDIMTHRQEASTVNSRESDLNH